jgi:hypothetical protein
MSEAQKSRYTNLFSFFISASVHFVAFMLFYTQIDKSILFAERSESAKSFAIQLSQISTNNSSEEMQATQNQSDKILEAPVIEEVAPQPKVEEPKQEKPKEQIKEEIKKITPKQKPLPRPVIKPKPLPKEEPIKPVAETITKADTLPTPANLATPASVPTSQSVANNESVKQGGAPQSGESNSQERARVKSLLGEIYAQILKHKTYPKRAVNSGMEGRVMVRFLLKDECEFEALDVVRSSGHSFLDAHALKIIKSACKDFPREAIGMDIKFAVVFDINEAK